MQSPFQETLKKSEIAGVLERICQALELSATQHELAKNRYETVGNWLADADHSPLQTLVIYPQGSMSLGTTVKPVGQNEHDVDLVSFVPGVGSDFPPATLKRVIGERLKNNGHYAPILEEMARCWRLNYANEFHMDITPPISNPLCSAGGELVPDKTLNGWKASNPKGYRAQFERRASLQPRMRLQESTGQY